MQLVHKLVLAVPGELEWQHKQDLQVLPGELEELLAYYI
jgi:hypothetical protein